MASKGDKKKQTIDSICKYIKMVDPSGNNSDRYRQILTDMTIEQFDEYMQSLKDGEDVLYVTVNALTDKHITFENNEKVAEKLKVGLYKRLKITDPLTGKKFLTPLRYMIVDLPVRRQIQTIKSGLSTAPDSNRVDPTTGQVVGESKAASLSTPETYVLYGKGLNNTIVELTKVRGGDTDAQRHIYNKLEQTGFATLEEAMNLGTRATSTETLNTLFKTIHIDNNI